MNKADLLTHLRPARAAWDATLAEVSTTAATLPNDSVAPIKDIIAHVT